MDAMWSGWDTACGAGDIVEKKLGSTRGIPAFRTAIREDQTLTTWKKWEDKVRIEQAGIERRALSQEIDVNALAANIREGTQAALDEAAVLGARLQELDQREK
jgi:hypothetical protein